MIAFIAPYLRTESYRVIEAANGTEAIVKLRAAPEIDLVLLNWMLHSFC